MACRRWMKELFLFLTIVNTDFILPCHAEVFPGVVDNRHGPFDSRNYGKKRGLRVHRVLQNEEIENSWADDDAEFPKTRKPTSDPTIPLTSWPTSVPSFLSSDMPSDQPSREPTFLPTHKPSHTPTHGPTAPPTVDPTSSPTSSPTKSPTNIPTAAPTTQPTNVPTLAPTHAPSVRFLESIHLLWWCCSELFSTDDCSCAVCSLPQVLPTFKPTIKPTASPSHSPTAKVRLFQKKSMKVCFLFVFTHILLSLSFFEAVWASYIATDSEPNCFPNHLSYDATDQFSNECVPIKSKSNWAEDTSTNTWTHYESTN